jgi:hypothetical protein
MKLVSIHVKQHREALADHISVKNNLDRDGQHEL